MSTDQTWDIFCAVVDNYGDVGVSWRLARQLAGEYGFRVRLWLDDLPALARICPAADPAAGVRWVEGVEVRPWPAQFPAAEPAQVVVEAFGCALPDVYVAAMAARERPPLWLNLEYLSAEAWIEGCHRMPSPHPRLPLTKYFFFPGFTAGSGGLPAERGLFALRDEFQGDAAARARFWQSLGLPPPGPDETRISLFGYANGGVGDLLDTWSRELAPLTCLVPEGRLAADVGGFFGAGGAAAGDVIRRGALTAHILPFLEQSRYDRLLWACDCNFVRGEDSFVRAQWAARPLVWHIYPQEEDAHWVKLEAFLARYCSGLPEEEAAAVREMWAAWNRGAGAGEAWGPFWSAREALVRHWRRWADELLALGGLAANLVNFSKAML